MQISTLFAVLSVFRKILRTVAFHKACVSVLDTHSTLQMSLNAARFSRIWSKSLTLIDLNNCCRYSVAKFLRWCR